MVDSKVLRKESKRWVAPQTSYDGDDWGNEYDEYEGYDDYADYAEEVTSPSAAAPARHEAMHALNTIAEEGKSAPTEEEKEEKARPAASERKATRRPVQTASSPVEEQSELARSNTVTGSRGGDAATAALPHSAQEADDAPHKLSTHESSREPAGSDIEGETTPVAAASPALSADAESNASPRLETDDGSIQDIYGFYENRYSQHPYSAIVSGGHRESANDLSDSNSTASLSTGRYSVDSTHPPRSELGGSVDYQSDLRQVPEVTFEANPATPQDRNAAGASGEAPQEQIEGLRIRKVGTPGHSREASGASDISHEFHNDTTAPLAGTRSENPSPARPYSQVVDQDIAELYQGSSEILNRPISTYDALPPVRDISDQSIRELLTPRAAQGGFDPLPPSDDSAVPSLFVTAASPERLRSEKIAAENDDSKEAHYEPYQAKAQGDAPDTRSWGNRSETTVATGESSSSARASSFENDHDYVDQRGSDGEGSAGSGSDSDMSDDEGDDSDATSGAAHRGSKPDVEPFVLPSERNRLQTISTHSSAVSADNASVAMSAHSDRSSQHASHNSVSRESDSSKDTSHLRQSSDLSSGSAATGVTSGAATDPGNPESPDTSELVSTAESAPETTETAESAPESASGPADTKDIGGAAPQPIMAKVKRPPQVDFSTLFNNSGSSESRCEQLRLLRVREAEYSSGLETWLTTTLSGAENGSEAQGLKIYVNGNPPASTNTAYHDVGATAMVTNVMHNSATNTKEKLGKVSGKVGEKSKSFFGKIMR